MTGKISITLSNDLLYQSDMLAQHLQVSQDQLIEMALMQLIAKYQNAIQPEQIISTVPANEHPEVINQGDLYWLQVEDQTVRHPYVIIQDNLLNHSRLNTLVVCALTSNPKRASYPGNVLLETGEGNLPKASVVEVSKISTVQKNQLGAYIGTLSEQRVHQILAGIRFQQASFFDSHQSK